MPQITKISTQKKQGRYNVEIDGAFAFGISEVLLAREGIFKGKELSLQKVEELRISAVEDKLYERALRFLAIRPRSRREMEFYLRKKEASEDATVAIISSLKEQNYLNDTSFARWWVGQRTAGKNPKGPVVIKAELYQKGVAPEVVEKALAEAEKETEDLVVKAAKACAARLKGLPVLAFKRRLTAYLLRRGFLWEDVKPVVDELAN